MGAVHAFVAEHFAEFVYAVEPADDQAFQVQFVGDAQEKRHVQRVVVRFERARRRAAVDRLQDGCFHFQQPQLVEVGADGFDHLRALQEYVAHVGVHRQIDVAHAVALFRISEGVENVAFSVAFDDGKRAQAFGQQLEFPHMHRYFPGFGFKSKPPYPDEIAQVEQFFYHGIPHCAVFAGADLFAAQVQLDAAAAVLQVHKHGLAGFAGGHDPARQGHILIVQAVFGTVFQHFFLVMGHDIGGEGRHVEHFSRVGVDAEFAQFLQRFAAEQFLFSHVF